MEEKSFPKKKQSAASKYRKKERNKRRRLAVRKKRKAMLHEAISKSKLLEEQLEDTKFQLKKANAKSLEVRKELYKTPKVFLRPKVSSLHYSVRTKPTATSVLRPLQKSYGTDHFTCQVNKLDRFSLQSCGEGMNCDLGSGSFGKCTKMLLCSTEVAVKMITLDEYSYDNIMCEALAMAHLCHGHPNLPLFVGVYDQPEHSKPLLVTKFYSVAGLSCTYHQYLRRKDLHKDLPDFARILVGVCNGLQAIHSKGYLHNDLKCDNVVLSDCVPNSKNAPSLWPIVIDFGKARPLKSPKTYNLSGKEKEYYLKSYTHLAPELVQGSAPQSVLTDVYSLCRIIGKTAAVSGHKQLKQIASLSSKSTINRPSLLLVHDSLIELI